MLPYPLFLDIETARADRSTWAIPEKLLEPVKPAGNVKDPEKVAASIAERQKERDAEIEEAWAKTSFDCHQGRLLCVGVAVGDDAPETAYDVTLSNPATMLDLVVSAYREALRRGNGRAVIVGHNVKGFDAPWIWRIAVREGHELARLFPFRKWGEGLADTNELWSATNPRDYTKLAVICKFLGIEVKTDLDGSQVWDAYVRGEHERIATYCGSDVGATREAYRRMVGGGW